MAATNGEMRNDFSMMEEFALIALNGLDSRNRTEAKKAALFGIEAARRLQEMFQKETEKDAREFAAMLQEELEQMKKMKHKDFVHLEKEITEVLTAEEVMAEVPNLLGCDMNYYTAGVTMKEYKSEESIYQRIIEEIRATILEPGKVPLEIFTMLWLMRECGCMHDIFSQEEQKQVEQRCIELKSKEEYYRILWESEFHNVIRNAYLKILRWKHNFFKNPYLEGINLIFPFLDRKQAIFIDMVVMGTNVKGRRQAVIEFVIKNGHTCTELEMGEETLLKIDNSYYRIWPYTRRAGRIPIQGVELLPVYR